MKYKNNIPIIAIFSVFAIFLIWQHQFLYLYHDDYGYASISYAYQVKGVEGTQFSFAQIIEFLQGHYQIWGGRILYFFLEIVLLHYTGLAGFRIIQALAIWGIFFLIYKIMKKVLDGKVKDWILALVSIILYGVTEIMTFRTGLFWISASVLYVIPIFSLLLFVYLYTFKEPSKARTVFLVISIFMATFSQEQVGIASLMYIVICTGYNAIKNKKLNKLDICLTIVSCIAFAILMLAPGNELRKQHPTSIGFYQTPFIQRTLTGITETITGNFSQYNKIFGFFFFATALLFNIKCIQKNLGIKWLNCISLISTAGIFLMTFIKPEGYFDYVYHLKEGTLYTIFIAGITLLQLGCIAYTISIYLWDKDAKSLLFLFYCAIISQGVMIVAPYFALRSSIMFEYLYYLIGLNIIGDIYIEKDCKTIIACTFTPFLLLCICNMALITKGYFENSKVNKENDLALKSVQQQLEAGNEIHEVTLQKLPDISYSGEQPYTEGNDYILHYMKEYYNLPEDFVIQYQD